MFCSYKLLHVIVMFHHDVMTKILIEDIYIYIYILNIYNVHRMC